MPVALLNEVGRRLEPEVRCVIQLASRGTGEPNGGLYTANQCQVAKNCEPLEGQRLGSTGPSRSGPQMNRFTSDVSALPR